MTNKEFNEMVALFIRLDKLMKKYEEIIISQRTGMRWMQKEMK